jgi:ABC-type nitrate/sulfonate/bicarbonate transport system substrate-binding protein
MTHVALRIGRREFLTLGTAALLPSAWALAAPRRARAAPREHVRFGVGSAIAYNPIYVAKEKGFYEEEGLDVEFLWAQAAPEVIQATIGGSAEGGVGGSFGMIAGAEKGAPVITVAVYAYGGERIALAVRSDSGINSVKDLYGKKVGFQSGAIGQQMFGTMAQVEQLDTSKIDTVFLNNVDMPAAVAARTIDAIVTWEPQPSLLEAKGLVRVIQRGGKYLKSPGCVMFGTDYIKKNPEAVRRFVKAHFRGCQFIRQHPREASVINAKYVRGAVPEVLEKSYKYLVFDPRVTREMLGEFEADMRFMLAQKKLAKAVDSRLIATPTFTDDIERQFPELVKDLK